MVNTSLWQTERIHHHLMIGPLSIAGWVVVGTVAQKTAVA